MGLKDYAFGHIPKRMDEISLSPAEAFRQACSIIGSQQAVGKLVGRTQSAVSKRLAAGKACWAEDVLKIEEVTGVSRHDLRPDVYPPHFAVGPIADVAGHPEGWRP